MTRRSLLIAAVLISVQAVALASSSPPCAGALAIPMQRERTGTVTVVLDINGSATRFVVDTGANTSTLDVGKSRTLRLDVQPTQGLPAGQGPATATVAAGKVVLGEQTFGVFDLNFINDRLKQFTTAPFEGQLGASFFTDFGAEIDFSKMVLCVTLPTRSQ
jgi:hypothetical protein